MLRSLKNRLTAIFKHLKMGDESAAVALSKNKRHIPGKEEDQVSAVKTAKTDQEHAVHQPNEMRKRKVALLMIYSGAGYHGVQINKGVRTIEGEFVSAIVKAGVVPPEHGDDMTKMCFQRASRTDKGVSALGQVFSLKMKVHEEDVVEKINSHLPQQIRAIAYKRVTKGFNSKNFCDARTYIYLLPTYAFSPLTVSATEEYRITDDILEDARRALQKFVGTHNFHNFTSQVKPTDRSAMRYMQKLEMSEPFMREGIEWAVITIKGQSFMLHHIRKMIGLAVAVVRGFATNDIFDKVFLHEKMDVPKVPGLGLVLEKLHYDGYNKRYASDGSHEPLEWSQYQDRIDAFKEREIFSNIIHTEKTEHTMLLWLENLLLHKCDVHPPQSPRTPLAITRWRLDNPDKVHDDMEGSENPKRSTNVDQSETPTSQIAMDQSHTNDQPNSQPDETKARSFDTLSDTMDSNQPECKRVKIDGSDLSDQNDINTPINQSDVATNVNQSLSKTVDIDQSEHSNVNQSVSMSLDVDQSEQTADNVNQSVGISIDVDQSKQTTRSVTVDDAIQSGDSGYMKSDQIHADLSKSHDTDRPRDETVVSQSNVVKPS